MAYIETKPQRRNKNEQETYAREKHMQYTESKIQQTIYSYFCLKYPSYQRLFSASAVICSSAKTGGRLKASGVQRGWPDISIAVPRGAYHGLYIELKTETGFLSQDQQLIIDQLNNQGYKASCQKGLDACIKEIDNYLAL